MPHREPASEVAISCPRHSQCSADILDASPCPCRLYPFGRRGYVAQCGHQCLQRTECGDKFSVIVQAAINQSAICDSLPDDPTMFVKTLGGYPSFRLPHSAN